MNDLNPTFLVLIAFAAALGALIAGGTGALVGVVLVTGVGLAAPFVAAALASRD